MATLPISSEQQASFSSMLTSLSHYLAGLVIGLCAAYAATRLLTSQLYNVSAADPMTFTLIALLLTGAALAAGTRISRGTQTRNNASG